MPESNVVEQTNAPPIEDLVPTQRSTEKIAATPHPGTAPNVHNAEGITAESAHTNRKRTLDEVGANSSKIPPAAERAPSEGGNFPTGEEGSRKKKRKKKDKQKS